MHAEMINAIDCPLEEAEEQTTDLPAEHIFRISGITRNFLRGFYEDFLLDSTNGRTLFMLERFLRVTMLEGRVLAEKTEDRPYRMLRRLYANSLCLPPLRVKMLKAHSPQDIIRFTEEELDALFAYGLYDGLRAEFADRAAKIEEE